jgi:hypothetical protein
MNSYGEIFMCLIKHRTTEAYGDWRYSSELS